MSTLLSLTKSFLSVLLVLFRYLFYRAITSFLTGIVLFFVAVLMFITFHQAYMPVVSHVKPVYLQFSSDCQDPSAGLCSYPEASVYFTSKNNANDKRMLMRGQSYKVFLDIEMPSSPTNEKLGMFMVNLKFLSSKGTVLKSSSRSCMLHYESNLVRLFRTIFYSLPLTLGLTEEKQKVEINFFEDYIDDSYNPAVQAKVVIMTKQVEFYSSTLRLQASFTGLRYIIFNWPFLFACFAVLVNFITITLIFSACVNQLYPNSSTTSNSQQHIIQSERNNSSQQNGVIASNPGTRAAMLTNDGQQCTQQVTPPPLENEATTSDNTTTTPDNSISPSNGLLLNSQEQSTTPRTILPRGALSKPGNRLRKRIPLGQLKLSRKRLKIKKHKTVKIGIVNQEENKCNDVNPGNSFQYPSSVSSENVTEIYGPNAKSDFVSINSDRKPKSHKMTSNTNESTSYHNKPSKNKSENRQNKLEITGRKTTRKKTRSGEQKKSYAKSSDSNTTGLSCELPAETSVEVETVLDSFCLTRNWEAMIFPRVENLGRYFEENLPVLTRRIRQCVSNQDLSTIEENGFASKGFPKRSSSTSDLTLNAG